VRAESPPADHRVAGEAVTLDMAGDAALQRLPRCLPVPDEEVAIAVVISAGAQQRAPGGNSRLIVTALAEFAGIVALGARPGARVRVGGMPGQVTGRMVTRAPAGVRKVAGQTVIPHVTAGAALHARRGDGPMAFLPLRSVARGKPGHRLCSGTPARARGQQGTSGPRGVGAVTLETALLRVTGPARRAIIACEAAMPLLEVPGSVAGRRHQLLRNRE